MTKRLAIVLFGGLVCFGCNSENPMGPSGAGVPAAPPVAPAAAPPKPAGPPKAALPVLYDARDRAKLPPGVEREPKLAPEIEKLVFSALSATYKAKREECQGAGDVFFHVTASALGPFTAPTNPQAAYVVASQGCDPGGAIESTHLVIVEGGKVVMEASGKTKVSPGEPPRPFYGTEIRAVADVDQDGAAELLITTTVAPPAGLQDDGRLYTAAGGAIKQLKVFQGTYLDGCVAGPKAKVLAQVIHYAPGAKEGASQFSAEAYEAPCPASGAPKPTDFQPVKPPAAPAGSPAPSPVPTAAPAGTPAPAATASPAATPSPAPTAQPSP